MSQFSNIKPEMRYYFLIIAVLFFGVHSSAWSQYIYLHTCNAQTTIQSCPAGCYWDATLAENKNCTQCPANTFKPNRGPGECTDCPIDYPYSSTGSSEQKDCYLKCSETTTTIDNGSYTVTAKAQYKETCTPTCQPVANPPQNMYAFNCNFDCSNAANMCDGYHPENINNKWQCKPNLEISDSTLKVWVMALVTDGSYIMQSKDYLRSCNDGYHLENIETICGHQVGTKCEQNSVSCSKRLSAEENAWISGNAEYKDGAWDYSKCTRQLDVSDGDTKYTQICPYQSGEFENTVWSTTNCTNEIKSCGTGLCGYNGVCQSAPRGYYGNGNAACRQCPAGATSNAGAKSQSECFMQRGVTEFCDSTGKCFTLGGSGNIPHTPTTN